MNIRVLDIGFSIRKLVFETMPSHHSLAFTQTGISILVIEISILVTGRFILVTENSILVTESFCVSSRIFRVSRKKQYLCTVIQKEMPNVYGWLGCKVVASLA